mgnify:CR=1 FL=1
MIFSADATTHVLAAIPTTLAAVLSGLSSFYAAVATITVSVVLAAITTTAVTVFGLLFYCYAVEITILSVANLQNSFHLNHIF